MRGNAERLRISAITAALALLTVPMTPIIRPACTHCPPDCPMHAVSPDRHVKRGCHEARDQARNSRHCQPKTGFTRPGCGHARIGAPVPIVRAVLPQRPEAWIAPLTRAVTEPRPVLHLRDADPPESPPPILAV
jgi:hypothetical protein